MSVYKLNKRYLTAEEREVYYQRERYYQERHLFYIATQSHCLAIFKKTSCEECLVNKVCKKYRRNNLSKSEIKEYVTNVYIKHYGASKLFDELL